MGAGIATVISVGATAIAAGVSKVMDRISHQKMIEEVAKEITKNLEKKN